MPYLDPGAVAAVTKGTALWANTVRNDLVDHESRITAVAGGSPAGVIPAWSGTLSGTQAIANGADTVVNWTTGVNTYFMSDGSPDSTIQIQLSGIYEIYCEINYSANTAGTVRALHVALNGVGSPFFFASDCRLPTAANGEIKQPKLSMQVPLNGGDVLRFYGYQDSGTGLTMGPGITATTQTRASVMYVCPSS